MREAWLRVLVRHRGARTRTSKTTNGECGVGEEWCSVAPSASRAGPVPLRLENGPAGAVPPAQGAVHEAAQKAHPQWVQIHCRGTKVRATTPEPPSPVDS